MNSESPLKMENAHLNYITNGSQTVPTLSVEYQVVFYDHTNEKYKTFIGLKPKNDIANIQQNTPSNVLVPNDQYDQDGKVQIEYAVQVFSVKNSENMQELRNGFLPTSPTCRTEKDRNTLVLTDTLDSGSVDKIKCDSNKSQ
jgi:hypothetical protein